MVCMDTDWFALNILTLSGNSWLLISVFVMKSCVIKSWNDVYKKECICWFCVNIALDIWDL